MAKGRAAKPVKTVWVLTQLKDGKEQNIAVRETQPAAELVAMRLISTTCGVQQVRDLAWYPSTAGGMELVYGRDRWSFHFRIEPWATDGEV